MFDPNDEKAESSTAQDAGSESSTEQEQVQPAEGTAQKPVVQEPPFHEHPRFKEIIKENQELKDTVNRLSQQAFDIAKMSKPEQAVAVERKIYEANTPEEKQFWQTVEAVGEQKAQRIVTEKEKEFKSQINVLYDQFGKLAAKEFLRENPDIKPGSDDLKEIVQYAAKRGLDLDEAKKIVMYDKAQVTAAEKERVKYNKKTEDKRAANVESQTIPSNSIIKPKANSVEAAFDEALKEAGNPF